MYLSKRTYIPAYDFSRKEDHNVKSAKITIERTFDSGATDEQEIIISSLSSGITIQTPVAYWRKANAIHRWILEHTCTEEDDCKPIIISGQKLIELRDSCEAVLKDHSKAEELLPTQEGFFFGSTEYDECYFDDLQDTINQLKDIDKDELYTYQASW